MMMYVSRVYVPAPSFACNWNPRTNTLQGLYERSLQLENKGAKEKIRGRFWP